MFGKTKFFILFVLAIGLFAGIRLINAQNQSPEVPKYNSKKDKIVSPSFGDIKEEITLAGSISATDIASVRFQTSGKLAWVGAKVGDRVKKGQAIASLDKIELRKSLDKELNDYKTALHNFNDTQDTYKSTRENYLVTDAIKRILDRSQYTLNNEVINYELSELSLKLATIYSPIAGVVVAADQPLAGINITPATATFTVIDPNSIYFKSEIDEETVTRIKVGQAATVDLDSFSGQLIDSEISHISFIPISGESSTVYEVRLKLPFKNDDLNYRLGMSGDAAIILATATEALTVPAEAVYDNDGQKFVYLYRQKNLQIQNVDTGIETDTDVQITQGLTINDQIVIKQ